MLAGPCDLYFIITLLFRGGKGVILPFISFAKREVERERERLGEERERSTFYLQTGEPYIHLYIIYYKQCFSTYSKNNPLSYVSN